MRKINKSILLEKIKTVRSMLDEFEGYCKVSGKEKQLESMLFHANGIPSILYGAYEVSK